VRSKKPPDPDLTTRARIRDAAIGVFGDQGFATGVRVVAAAAGVSVGLVNHHFGSKDGLRVACDEWVLEFIWAEKAKAFTDPPEAGLLAAIAEVEVYGPVVAYIMRSFQAGGPLADTLLERMIDDTERLLAMRVQSGLARPSRDPRARARYITMSQVGMMNLYFQLRLQREGKIDYRKAIRDLTHETMFPILEIYTEGLLTDPSLLEALAASLETTTDTATEEH
jgi:AcrR family transcriptional regulator